MRFRSDIQALRGIAVLLVVLQHARPGLIDAGYLGVDIFFVVSGYLITGLVARAIADGSFRFSEFYFRRAKRLLPAAYVTFAMTALLASLLLDAGEWRDFTRQLAGAVSFTANFVLLGQTGYFEGAALLKPLLHVWSLAIEEQYYLLLPAAMVWLPGRFWRGGALIVLLASFALYLWLAPDNPSAAFYLLPTRAWELALGSVAALATWPGRTRAALSLLVLPALLVLLVVPVWSPMLPSLAKLPMVCLATFVLVAAPQDGTRASPLVAALAWVGDFSYSLYLVHWPVFAFLNNLYAGDPAFGAPSDRVLLAATALALGLGYLLYRTVELPVRRASLRPSWPLLAGTLAVSLSLALVPLGIAPRTGLMAPGKDVDFVALRQDNLGFGKACEFDPVYRPIAECRNASEPRMLVWGDSFAMQLVPGIVATTDAGVAQATKSVCGPLLGLAQVTTEYPRAFAEHCLAFNQSVIDYLAATPSVRVVVLSSPFYQYFDPQRRLLHQLDGKLVERAPNEELAIAVLDATVARLRALGKRVVIVAPPPSNGFDFTHCIERRAAGSRLLGRFVDCDIPLAEYRASKAKVLDFLARVEAEADVPVVRFDAVLCDGARCRTELDGSIVYRDEGHFSYEGSRAVARRMQLGTLLEQVAK